MILFLKVSFNKTNFPLFLHYYELFLNDQTTVQNLQVIIISLIICSSIIVLWCFSYNICVVDFDMCVCINRIIVHWYWNLSSGVLENCQWAVSKKDIRIWSPHRFVQDLVKGSGWVFILVCINWLLCLIYDLHQVLNSILLLLIIDLCVSYLLDQRSLILKLVPGCVRNVFVGRIQTGHMDLLSLKVCGRLWLGWQI